MNKLTIGNKDNDKKIITFTIDKAIKQKLNEILVKSDKYNLKMKSEWVNEATQLLKENPDYKELVRSAEGSNEDFVLDKIYMDFNQRCKFAEMRNEVVKEYPDITGPQGAIIRAAILSRIMRKL